MKKLNTIFTITFTLSQFCSFPIYVQAKNKSYILEEESPEETTGSSEEENPITEYPMEEGNDLNESKEKDGVEESKNDEEMADQSTEEKAKQENEEDLETSNDEEIQAQVDVLQEDKEIVVQSENLDKGVLIDEEAFPDEVFRDYVKNNVDSDGDGYLSEEERQSITSIKITDNRSLESLEGIECFTQLEELTVRSCSLTNLDVSSLQYLRVLDCQDNSLTRLVLGSLPNLSVLACSKNNLSSLDISQCPALSEFGCAENSLGTLDVSGLSELVHLYCANCNLTELNISGLTKIRYLNCSNNNLLDLDVSQLTQLEEFQCQSNQLTALDLSNSSSLKFLHCEDNQLENLKVDHCSALTELFCQNNHLMALNLPLSHLECGTFDASNQKIYVEESSFNIMEQDPTIKLDNIIPSNDVSFDKNSGVFTNITTNSYYKYKCTDATNSQLILLAYLIPGANPAKQVITQEAVSVPEIDANKIYYTSQAIEPNPIVTLDGKQLVKDIDYTLLYSGNVKAGKGILVIIGKGKYTGTVSVGFTIRQVPITDSQAIKIEDIQEAYTYTGGDILPKPTVKLNGQVLEENVDYTLSYAYGTKAKVARAFSAAPQALSSPSNPGTVNVTITGIGGLTGSTTKTYTIEPASILDAAIEGIQPSYSYTGSQINPEFKLTCNNNALVKEKDYTVSYTSNTNIGKATITITGIGNYTGTLTKTFTIQAASLASASVSSIGAYTYSGKENKPVPTVTLNGKTLVNNTDYTLAYSSNTNAGTAKITITGKGNYSGTITKTFTIQAASLANASVSNVSAYTYSGKEIKPVPTITLNGRTLVNNTDYTLTYSSNINAGTARITITGKGNYFGSIIKSYTINKGSLSSASISGVNASYTYTGKEIKPAPTLMLNGKTLVNNTDYTLAYSSNTNAGTAKITINGKGNYSGTVTKTFAINKGALSSASISGVNASYTYTGKEIKPAPTLTLNGRTLTNNTDYTLSYASNINTGTAKITINGKGNYSGSVTKTFTIVASSVKMYRLYNPNSGEHFYTKNAAEKDSLVKVGWKYEGIGWNAPSQSNTPVYRLYNPNAGDHHYTSNVNEKNALVKVGWKYEGIGWYSDDAKGVPLYRQYNPNAKAGSHNYTTNKAENDSLIKVGWKGEGIGWYGTK